MLTLIIEFSKIRHLKIGSKKAAFNFKILFFEIFSALTANQQQKIQSRSVSKFFSSSLKY